jgi:hypothetical protein
MKIRMRNLADIDVSQADDHSSATLRFMTASEDEVVIVVPPELLQGLMEDLLALSSKAESPVTISEERTFENTTQNFLSKGATRAA